MQYILLNFFFRDIWNEINYNFNLSCLKMVVKIWNMIKFKFLASSSFVKVAVDKVNCVKTVNWYNSKWKLLKLYKKYFKNNFFDF